MYICKNCKNKINFKEVFETTILIKQLNELDVEDKESNQELIEVICEECGASSYYNEIINTNFKLSKEDMEYVK